MKNKDPQITEQRTSQNYEKTRVIQHQSPIKSKPNYVAKIEGITGNDFGENQNTVIIETQRRTFGLHSGQRLSSISTAPLIN